MRLCIWEGQDGCLLQVGLPQPVAVLPWDVQPQWGAAEALHGCGAVTDWLLTTSGSIPLMGCLPADPRSWFCLVARVRRMTCVCVLILSPEPDRYLLPSGPVAKQCLCPLLIRCRHWHNSKPGKTPEWRELHDFVLCSAGEHEHAIYWKGHRPQVVWRCLCRLETCLTGHHHSHRAVACSYNVVYMSKKAQSIPHPTFMPQRCDAMCSSNINCPPAHWRWRSQA